MKVQNIFGEWLYGEEKAKGKYDNICIFEDEHGERHVVHKSDLDASYKWRVTKMNKHEGNFDLELSKRIGRSGKKARKSGY